MNKNNRGKALHKKEGAPREMLSCLVLPVLSLHWCPCSLSVIKQNLPVCQLGISAETRHIREYHSLALSKLTKHHKKSMTPALMGLKPLTHPPPHSWCAKGHMYTFTEEGAGAQWEGKIVRASSRPKRGCLWCGLKAPPYNAPLPVLILLFAFSSCPPKLGSSFAFFGKSFSLW